MLQNPVINATNIAASKLLEVITLILLQYLNCHGAWCLPLATARLIAILMIINTSNAASERKVGG
jgi:hypothetical protein